MDKKEIISCLCMNCGHRNDHTHPDGFCQNCEHDAWLEYRDVIKKNEFFKLTAKLAGIEPELFSIKFMDNSIKIIPLVNRPKVLKTWYWHFGQDITLTGGLSSQITCCQWKDIVFYTRENANGIDSFLISSPERWGDKAGSTPGSARQVLELFAPADKWKEVAAIVKLNDTKNRPVKQNKRFTQKWINENFSKDKL
jgi:hypothetical protein